MDSNIQFKSKRLREAIANKLKSQNEDLFPELSDIVKFIPLIIYRKVALKTHLHVKKLQRARKRQELSYSNTPSPSII